MSIGFILKSPLGVVASDLRVYCLEADVAFSSWVPRRHFVSKGCFASIGSLAWCSLFHWGLSFYFSSCCLSCTPVLRDGFLPKLFLSPCWPQTLLLQFPSSRPLPWLRLWLGNAVTGFIFCLDTSSILTSLFHFPTTRVYVGIALHFVMYFHSHTSMRPSRVFFAIDIISSLDSYFYLLIRNERFVTPFTQTLGNL